LVLPLQGVIAVICIEFGSTADRPVTPTKALQGLHRAVVTGVAHPKISLSQSASVNAIG